ncbi:NnrS family protein, partial [Palleronia sp.]|uniref:NnrS family protein n=1 Tax=Palleronia sp. TaxID=1940284 RepID=UPI0035C83666
DRAVLADPLLWGLHVGFGWLALGLLAYAAAELGAGVAGTHALHLILIGAVGTLTLVISLRLIRAQAREAQRGDWKDGMVLALVSLAALLRGGLPLVAQDWYGPAVAAGGAVWSVAMALALAIYFPRLLGWREGKKT